MGVCLVPEGKGHTIALDKAVVFIGRHPDCDIVLMRSRKVSRKHCCVAQVNDRFVIRDLGSMNGVRVNGQRIEKERRINIGDEIAIGDVRYVMQVHKPKPNGEGSKGGNENVDSAAEPPVSDAAGSPSGSPKPAQPLDLSHDFPVVIPEGDESFQVEPSSDEL